MCVKIGDPITRWFLKPLQKGYPQQNTYPKFCLFPILYVPWVLSRFPTRTFHRAGGQDFVLDQGLQRPLATAELNSICLVRGGKGASHFG